MIDFPSPILSVSTDVVRDLDGQDALYGMWTVFTKCKQSLKDGRRLENISWRLWYREMATSHPNECHSSGSSSPAQSDGRCSSPLTPLSEDGPQHGESPQPTAGLTSLIDANTFASPANWSRDSLMPIPDPTARHSWHGDDHPPPTAVRRLSTVSMPVRPRSHPTQCLGSLILDILPKGLVPAQSHSQARLPCISASKSAPSHPGTARPSPAARGVTGSGSSVHSPVPSMAHPRPVPAIPTLNLPSTPPNAGAPRVVVVNPTPHPTPPATPHPAHSTAAHPAHASTHLNAPPVHPSLAAVQPRATMSPAPSKQDAPAATAGASAGLHTQLSSGTTSRKGGDETLKPSDRRFFLQTSESPDQDSPERGDPATSKSPDPPEPSPSSGTSSHVKSEGIHAARRSYSRAGGARRGKEFARLTSNTRSSTTKLHTARQLTAHRKAAPEPKKTTFNIGSVSSNGTKSDHQEAREPSQKASSSKQNQTSSKGRQAALAAKTSGAVVRKGLVMSTSSDYTTDSDDDSEWASEDNVVEDPKGKEKQKEESRLREAAEEAKRQRDMFAKADRRSYTSLPTRARSGLLSQLLNPDPNIFPPDHPYRVKSLTDMSRLGRPPVAPGLATSKSSAALPLAAQITQITAQASPPSTGAGNNGNSNNGYRPKGRPQGQEMEDDSESEDENGENSIQLSRSLAQQKLAALAGPGRRRASDQAVWTPPQAAATRPALTTVATAPIPLAHPYNLPAPAPPMTPRTTRRQMLSTELSESLRRNLLWERQVSKVNMLGGARRTGLLSQGLRPLTAVNANANANTSASSGANAPQHQQQQVVRGEVPADDREERRRAAVARNRSWADDYHYSGW